MRSLPKPRSGRVETGAVQFGEDYPGVLIRGSDALAYGEHLYDIIQYMDPNVVDQEAVIKLLTPLLKLLWSCDLMSMGKDVKIKWDPKSKTGTVPKRLRHKWPYNGSVETKA
jgi:hypothetical protein